MAFELNDKIFYGSLMTTLDRRKILGNQDLCHLRLLKTLFKSLKYAEAQFNAGATTYEAKIRELNAKIYKLKKCEKICDFKERLLLSHSCVNP